MTMKRQFNNALMKLTFIKLGLEIKINRKHRGMSVPELAKRAKVTSNRMRKIERGNDYKLKIDTLTRIAQAFDCAYDIIFITTEEKIKRINEEPLIVPTFTEETN